MWKPSCRNPFWNHCGVFMAMGVLMRKILICLLAAMVLCAPLGLAQQAAPPGLMGEKPVMENVFFNVVWGSVFGIVLGAASAVIEAEEKTSPDNLRDTVFGGATVGGLIGLGVALWLFSSGITFEKRGTLLFTSRDPEGFARPVAVRAPPFTLETTTNGPLRVSGFRATVLDFRF